jgi:hypothetical protein
MPLTDDEKAQLDALTAKANEPDSDDDFEIELFTPEGHGARVPYRKGRSFLQTHFGIDLDPDPGDGNDNNNNNNDAGKDAKGSAGTGKGKAAGKAAETKTGAGFFRSQPRT